MRRCCRRARLLGRGVGQVVADGGGVYVALLALDQQGAPVSCEVISAASIDGGLFWQTSLGVDGAAAMIDGVCAGGNP